MFKTTDRNYRCAWLFGAAIAASAIAPPLPQAVAQTVSVQNIDEPGRIPYQQTVQGGFHNFAGFQVSFSVVQSTRGASSST